MATFESQNRRMPKIEACLKANGLESLDACNEMLLTPWALPSLSSAA